MKGEKVTHVSVPAGTIIFVGIAGSNRSEAVWGEDAKEWKPERWLGDLKQKGPKEKVPGIYSGM
jgi:cytochrome P450